MMTGVWQPMPQRLACFAACLTILAADLWAQEPRRPMTTDDGLNMVGFSDVLISPDGRFVFYGKSELDWEKNKRNTTYWLVPSGGGEPFRYIGEDGGSAFQFSPHGTYLAFTRSVEEKRQLFLMRTAGGEAVQLTKHATSIGMYRWAPDERALFFVAEEPRSAEEEKNHKAGEDAVFVDEGPNGQEAARWNNLWKVAVPGGEEERLTEEEFRIGELDVSPLGTRIAFTARFENRRNQANRSEIYLWDLAAKARTRLTENQAPEGDLEWAPDGKRLAYTAPSDTEWDLRLDRIWVMDVETKRSRAVSTRFSGNIARYAWTPDGRAILFGALERTNANLYRLDVEGGAVQQVTRVTGSLRVLGFSADRSRMVYAFEDLDTPPDLYSSPTARLAPTRLTELNPWVERELALAGGEVTRWKSRDGMEVEGILLRSPGPESDARAPFLLHIHGGPAGVFANEFRSSLQVWAGLGYVQLLPNVRGSSGYTDELLRGNMRDIGGGDYWDLMTGVDALVARGLVDSTQMGLRGWSYGGILGGWTITQTDRFKAASLGAMVSDWTSEYGSGFNHDVRLWYIGGTPWENPDRYRQMSPLTHVARVKTPTLIMHGIEDRTDTEPQSMMFFAALKDQGREVRYIRFPREPHGFREPRHQRIRDVEEIRWIQKYVRGIEWTPWIRPASPEAKPATVTSSHR
jgi:dipeptidyl aminopeptidase/acylaminoacyl peptidase